MVQNFARDRDETESLVYFSLETETRPRLSPISGTYLYNLVKIGPVTAEILLIWTNVARTNVAWTNVHLTIVLDCPE